MDNSGYGRTHLSSQSGPSSGIRGRGARNHGAEPGLAGLSNSAGLAPTCDQHEAGADEQGEQA
ncbi:MAG TPA: hypothetical protein VF821_23525, partial [Lentzea sp.]